MVRLLLYTVTWLLCNLAIATGIAALGTLLLVYVAIGPFACVYVGARLGTWCDFDFLVTSILMLAGLWLFGSVRLRLYRHVLRWWRRGHRFLYYARLLRDDIWRQYRHSLNV